mmetsp:Transcript_25401/g.40738  ORF Transcript_25401/g.40738 Transcript_25401/m.40738 type:complete len:263 (-) Transcript_25401:162-950(-)
MRFVAVNGTKARTHELLSKLLNRCKAANASYVVTVMRRTLVPRITEQQRALEERQRNKETLEFLRSRGLRPDPKLLGHIMEQGPSDDQSVIEEEEGGEAEEEKKCAKEGGEERKIGTKVSSSSLSNDDNSGSDQADRDTRRRNSKKSKNTEEKGGGETERELRGDLDPSLLSGLFLPEKMTTKQEELARRRRTNVVSLGTRRIGDPGEDVEVADGFDERGGIMSEDDDDIDGGGDDHMDPARYGYGAQGFIKASEWRRLIQR